MKKIIAKYSSIALSAFALVFVFSLKGLIGKADAPSELLKK